MDEQILGPDWQMANGWVACLQHSVELIPPSLIWNSSGAAAQDDQRSLLDAYYCCWGVLSSWAGVNLTVWKTFDLKWLVWP